MYISLVCLTGSSVATYIKQYIIGKCQEHISNCLQHLIIIAVRLCFRTKRNWQMKLVTDANISKLLSRTLAQNGARQPVIRVHSYSLVRSHPCQLPQFGARLSVSIATVRCAAIRVNCHSSVRGRPCPLVLAMNRWSQTAIL